MKWIPAYATGISQVDDQHKMIFKMSEDFQEALATGQGEKVYAGLLVSLQLYAKAHFRFEEGCMAKYACPAYGRNKAAHEQFLTTLERHLQGFRDTGYIREDAQTLMELIDEWLSKHIANIDVQLRDVVMTVDG